MKLIVFLIAFFQGLFQKSQWCHQSAPERHVWRFHSALWGQWCRKQGDGQRWPVFSKQLICHPLLPVFVHKVCPCRHGGEVLPPGRGAVLQDPGVHYRKREDDPGRCWPVCESSTWRHVLGSAQQQGWDGRWRLNTNREYSVEAADNLPDRQNSGPIVCKTTSEQLSSTGVRTCVCSSVYSGAGRLPPLPAGLLPGDRHLLLQTSRRLPQHHQHLPAPCLSLL